jgi:hypothetical protein
MLPMRVGVRASTAFEKRPVRPASTSTRCKIAATFPRPPRRYGPTRTYTSEPHRPLHRAAGRPKQGSFDATNRYTNPLNSSLESICATVPATRG